MLLFSILAGVFGSVLYYEDNSYEFNTWFSLSNSVYDVDGTSLVMINDSWSFCMGDLPSATTEHQTALAMIDIYFLFLGCDFNEITDYAYSKGYEAVLGNFPPDMYLVVWGVDSDVPAETYPNWLGFKWTVKGHTIPVALTQGFNEICPDLADCAGATMDLKSTYDGFDGFIAITTVYGLIGLILVLFRSYHSFLRIREMYPSGWKMLLNPAFYVIVIQLIVAPCDIAYLCDWTVTLGVYSGNVSHMLNSVSLLCSNLTTAILAALQLRVSRQFLPKYYLVIGSFLALAGVVLMEIGTLLYFVRDFSTWANQIEQSRRIMSLTGLIALTTCFLTTRLYLIRNISKGAKAEHEVAKTVRMSKLLFLAALFMTVWIVLGFLNVAWVTWPWSPIFYWSFFKASTVFTGPIMVLSIYVVPFLHVYALPYKSDRVTTGST